MQQLSVSMSAPSSGDPATRVTLSWSADSLPRASQSNIMLGGWSCAMQCLLPRESMALLLITVSLGSPMDTGGEESRGAISHGSVRERLSLARWRSKDKFARAARLATARAPLQKA